MSRLVLGCMRIEGLDDGSIRSLVDTALDVGITTFDHADIYGSTRHACERRFGEAAGLTGARREKAVVQTKVGIREGYYDFSREHVRRSVDESLEALRVDHVDVLLLHRPDALADPDDVAETLDGLVAAGKVRAIGVSNHTAGQIALLERALPHPIVANQMQLGLGHAPMIAAGLAANVAGLDQSVDRDGGVLDACRLRDITVQAWSPFADASGRIVLGDREHHADLNDALDEIAAAHGVTPTAVATAWITTHPAGMQVVVGSTRPERIREAAPGADLRLTRPEWYRLVAAAGYAIP
ncbi:aldo/keto reductase [Actinomycetospora soli]|uniref:aldo/keto reductase n=1 Tax=Actinomycetospora soli TaxID=2893887 RepID=UPI001E32F14E|nr:aldo/keto reductase [Actinomycetospora soli]MCD2185956.1 aldo/keto reductase [Actinomycetospora soli]